MMARIPNYAAPGELLDKRLKHKRVVPDGPGQRRPRSRDPQHLADVRMCPCLTCPHMGPCEAGHIRMKNSRYGKRESGIGQKPSDQWTVPLCHDCHMDQHTRGELLWWEEKGIEPCGVSLKLYARTGNVEAMTEVILQERKT